MERKLIIFDTTLRDGEQAPGCSMNTREKVDMARQLERLGVDYMEAGFPACSKGDFKAVRAVASVVKKCGVSALCRCVKSDIDIAWEAISVTPRPRLHLFLATSDLHMEYKLRMTRQEVLESIEEMVSYACQLCNDVCFAAEDACRTDQTFLVQALRTAVKAGAKTVNIPDTVGYSSPAEMYALVQYIIAELNDPSVVVSVHCHNDLGLAVANTLESVRAGAGQVECTVNGIGERAGNASLEEVVTALHVRKAFFQCETNIAMEQIYRTSQMLSNILSMPIAPNKAVVGANIFSHASGIHQHGVMENPLTYEIISPQMVGAQESHMVLGKHSGKHAFEERCAQLGFILSPADLEKAFDRFKRLASRKKDITDHDVEAILMGTSVQSDFVEYYKLENYVINSGTMISPTAVVRLTTKEGESKEHVARGEGPIDAAFKAIDRIVKRDIRLEHWNMRAVTEGEDALGEAISKIVTNGRTMTGRGLSPDILEASIKSYLNAINRVIAIEENQAAG